MARIRLDELRRISNALGATVDVRLRWRGGELDRVANAAHADLHAPTGQHRLAAASDDVC